MNETTRKRMQHGALPAAALLGAVLLSGCAKKSEATPQTSIGPLPVSAIIARGADVPLTGEWVGTLDGYVNTQIQPQVSGYLIKQNYREGAPVAQGQVLFEIDPRPFQASLDQAEGNLGQAKAQLQLSQINVKRDTPLAEAKAIAQSQLDNELQQMAQAQASVKSAEASVETAKLNLGWTQVRSLISGVAGQATTQVGNLVGPTSVLTSVSQLNPIKVYFAISDAEYLALTHHSANGSSDLLNGTSKIPLTLVLSNGETYTEKGHIVFVDRQMNAQTGAIRVAASFANPGNVLRPGQFGRVHAETQIQHNAILIPQTAVAEIQGIQQVYLAGDDGKVHAAAVKLGPQYGNNWVVESGIPAGAKVITDNLQKLREGAPVAPHVTELQTSASIQPAGR
ncbi:efflux RND transporter periplasmic adaptor subunit [Terriglobus albidus]|uniref:Efflux RND transporter periplasmic adaptor subunit n=1 Tax=Terriglobus albidus TaxID=1592106 RepID=A0A5B9E6J2_9BACT|nr:efflux RND transporter periplasmic adaptor subunit [Terriglobus albidus]QEE27429.1 efflux RND transporter periplasmic adaptor subunit [Terriglobus albidus]